MVYVGIIADLCVYRILSGSYRGDVKRLPETLMSSDYRLRQTDVVESFVGWSIGKDLATRVLLASTHTSLYSMDCSFVTGATV